MKTRIRGALLMLSAALFVISLDNFVSKARQQQRSLLAAKSETAEPRKPQLQQQHHQQQSKQLLYMVTSLAEFDNGRRSTQKGYDRFRHTIVPVVSESVQSMRSDGWQVTVYLVCHYHISLERVQELQQTLPPDTFLHIWNNATPYGYAPDHDESTAPEGHIDLIPRALSRQHRFILKDWWPWFDLFVAFEDDMLVQGAHATHFNRWTQQLYHWRTTQAPHSIPMLKNALFYGPMTDTMLRRMLPGFIRVEVVPTSDWQPPNRQTNPNHHAFPNIPIDLEWNSTCPKARIDPSICCHGKTTSFWQSQPTVEQLRFWETSIQALSVRQLPDQSWVLLQAGNEESVYSDPNVRIGEFWTGKDHEQDYFDNQPRPRRNHGDFMNNQGGWMATRRQILEWHTERCVGGFLPPYDPMNSWQDDGLAKSTVEFWSGGGQLAGIQACNLQRFVPLDPDQFGRALLYHTSNNKQRQKYVMHRFAATHVQDFWGQLNTVRKNAERRKQMEMTNLKQRLRHKLKKPNREQ